MSARQSRCIFHRVYVHLSVALSLFLKLLLPQGLGFMSLFSGVSSLVNAGRQLDGDLA